MCTRGRLKPRCASSQSDQSLRYPHSLAILNSTRENSKLDRANVQADLNIGSVRVAQWLELPTWDHEVFSSNPARGIIQLMTARRFIAYSLFYTFQHVRPAHITKTYLYNFDPLKPHFYIVKLRFRRVYIIFLISAQKHRLWVLVKTASPRRF